MILLKRMIHRSSSSIRFIGVRELGRRQTLGSLRVGRAAAASVQRGVLALFLGRPRSQEVLELECATRVLSRASDIQHHTLKLPLRDSPLLCGSLF